MAMKEGDPHSNGNGEWKRPLPTDALKDAGLFAFAERVNQDLNVETIGLIVQAVQRLPLEYFSDSTD